MIKISETSFLNLILANRNTFSMLIFDIDGTLSIEGIPIPGAANVIRSLNKACFPYILLTNDAIRSTKEKSILLQNSGFDVDEENIISCGTAIKTFVKSHNLFSKKLFIMGKFGVPDYAVSTGCIVERDISHISECNAILIGELDYDWETTINAVFNFFIAKPDAPFVVANPDSFWPIGEKVHIGAGGVARFISAILNDYGIRVEPIYLGKPYSPIYEHLLTHIKQKHPQIDISDRRKILAIGDSMTSDIKGAKNMQFSSALVLSGVTKQAFLKQIPHESLPDFIFYSVG